MSVAQPTPVVRLEIVNTCGGNCFAVQEAQNGEFVSFDDYEEMRASLAGALDNMLSFIEEAARAGILAAAEVEQQFGGVRALIAKTEGSTSHG